MSEKSNGVNHHQASIFVAMQNLKDLSKKQQRMKIQKKLLSSQVIEVHDSDSENEVIPKRTRGKIFGELPFTLKSVSDESEDDKFAQSSAVEADIKPLFSMPLESPNISSAEKDVVDGVTSCNTSDGIILQDRIVIKGNVLISEKKSDHTLNISNTGAEALDDKQNEEVTRQNSPNTDPSLVSKNHEMNSISNTTGPSETSKSNYGDEKAVGEANHHNTAIIDKRPIQKNYTETKLKRPGSKSVNNSTNPAPEEVSQCDASQKKINEECKESKGNLSHTKRKLDPSIEMSPKKTKNCDEQKSSTSQSSSMTSDTYSSPKKELLGRTSRKSKVTKSPVASTSKKSEVSKSLASLSSKTSDTYSSPKKEPVASTSKKSEVTESPVASTSKKSEVSKSPAALSSKTSNTYSSPKKEPRPEKGARKMNLSYLTLIQNLFNSVFTSPYLKDLIPDEKPLLETVLSADQKLFYVVLKLCTFKLKWYNIFQFCQTINLEMEPKEVTELLIFLQDNNIVDVDYIKEDINKLLDNLNLRQLKSICDKYKLKRTLKTKDEIIAGILKYCNTQSTLTSAKSTKDLILKEISKKMGKSIKLKNSFQEAFHKAYILGTFTNSSFSAINDYFNCMLNKRIVFPDYNVEDYMVFYDRGEFARYFLSIKYRNELDKAFSDKNHLEALMISDAMFKELKGITTDNEDENKYKDVPHLKKFTAQSVYCRTLTTAAEKLKSKNSNKVRHWLEYLITTFPLSRLNGEWYNQLIWLYMRYTKPIDFEHSAELLIEILQKKRNCLSEVQLQMLGERGEQLTQRQNCKIDQSYHDTIADLVPDPIKLEHFPQTEVDARAIRSNESGRKRKYIYYDSDHNKNFWSVEKIALDYYVERCGYTGGQHCEGSLIKASFTLFFWDIIYKSETVVPGTFLSKLQQIPLDMMTTYFYTNRKDAIDKRLQEIDSEWSDSKTIEFIEHNFEMHSHEVGLCEPAVVIKDVKILEILVNCVGRKVLSKIYERLVKDIRQYISGFPDLLIWNNEENKSKFVEVKGENDKLSVKQKLWLKYLQSIGANVEVCLVHSMGSKRKKIDKVKLGLAEVKRISAANPQG